LDIAAQEEALRVLCVSVCPSGYPGLDNICDHNIGSVDEPRHGATGEPYQNCG